MSVLAPIRKAALTLATLFSLTALAESPSTFSPTSTQGTIAFGSCLQQWKDQPVWQSVSALSPNAFVFLGDNMYADKGDYLKQPAPQRIANAYDDLAATDEFQAFTRTAKQQGTQLYATWDDHDYGANDGGGDYPHKLASKAYFMDFFGLDKTVSGDATQPGIYQSHRLNISGLDVQVILLDTRSFRSPLKKDPHTQACPKTNNVADTSPTATVLGSEQWQWLEGELKQPAELRLIVSSIQIIPEQHCFEKWANFPLERQRLFDLIKQTQAEGVILLSGDRHHGEFSVLPEKEIGYPLYEITASGLNSAMGKVGLLFGEHNKYRSGDTLFDDHFGAITITTTDRDHNLEFQLRTADGELAQHLQVPLSTLSFNQ